MEARTEVPRFAELGARIRHARRRAGISQERLAPLVGTTRRHLIRLENGEHQASKPLASRLGEVLGVGGHEFRNGGDEDEDEDDQAMSALMSALRRVVRDELGRRADSAAGRTRNPDGSADVTTHSLRQEAGTS